MAKMGRPKVEDPRTKSLGVRVTDEEYKAIKKFASRRNTTITEMLLKGLRDQMREPAK